MGRLICYFFLLSLYSNTFGQTGVYVPEMVGLDQAVQNFMSTWDIPGGSVAVAWQGRLVYARGFEFANIATQDSVYPESRFRMASISKPITASAIFHLIEKGQLTLDDQVFGEDGILNDSIYSNLINPNYELIKIRHLLAHQGGWTNSGVPNVGPMFNPVNIANALSVPPPAMQQDIIRYTLANTVLAFAPGTNQEYANFGYCVLGRVIEKITGQGYEQYLKDSIFSQINAGSFDLGYNLLADIQENEVHYYDYPGAPLVPSCYGSGMVPGPYGGFNIEAMDAHGGWISNATDLVRFGLAIDGFNTKPDIITNSSINIMRSYPPGFFSFGHGIIPFTGGAYHTGLLPGSGGYVNLDDSGLVVAALFNRQSWNSNFLPQMYTAIDNAIANVSTFPTHDLFVTTTATNEIKMESVSVYPNPSDGMVIFSTNRKENTHLVIYNTTGQRLYTTRFTGNHIWDPQNEGLADGFYFYTIQCNSYSKSGKIICH